MPLKPGTAGYILLLAGFVMLAPVATDMYLAAMPDLAIYFSTTPAAVQMTMGIYMLGFAVGNLIHGPFGDRYGRKPVVFATLALFLIASIACVFARTIEELAFLRFLQAVGASGPGVMSRAIVRDAYSNKRAPMVLSHLGTVTGIAPIAAPIAGGFLHSHFGWFSIFYAMGAFGVMLAGITALAFTETLKPDHRQGIRPLRIAINYTAIFRNRIFLGHTLTSGFGFAGIFCFLSGSSFVFQEMFGFSASAFGLLFGGVTVGFLSGTFISGRLTRHYSSLKIQNAGAALGLVSGAIMALCSLVGIHSIWTVAVPQFFFLMGYGIMMPHAFAGAIIPFPHMAGTASSLFGFLRLGLSTAIGSIMAAFMTGATGPGAESPMTIAIGISALLAFLANQLVPHTPFEEEVRADAADPAIASAPLAAPSQSLAGAPPRPPS